jgi:diguanylate cyclase (GGDEF)-like protein
VSELNFRPERPMFWLMPRDPASRFAFLVIAAGLGVVAAEALSGAFAGIELSLSLVLLTAMVVVSELVQLRLPTQRGDLVITASNLFTVALVGLHGPGPALVALAAASVVYDGIHRRRPIAAAFNAAQLATSIAAGAWVMSALSGLPHQTALGAADVGALAAGAMTLVALNHVLASTVGALAMGVPIRTTIFSDTRQGVAADVALVCFAPVVMLIAVNAAVFLPLLLLPLGSLVHSAHEADRRRLDSLHDPLTGLPNRLMFARHIEQELARLRHSGGTFAVLMLDLDRFKEINDALGHTKGDAVLCAVGERLRSLAADECAARLGGDEFALVLGGDPSPHDALRLGQRVREALAEPVEVDGMRLITGASIGVAMGLDEHADVATMLRRADVAMYSAKDDGGGARLYERGSDPNTPERLALVAELRDAIPGGELVLHFQPKVALDDGRLEGVEALVRWQHPERGLLAPGAFLPLVERSDLMRPLSAEVLDQALRQLADWRGRGLDMTVAINLSAATLHDHGLAREIASRLRRFDVPPDRLQVEITESSLMRDPQRAGEVLEELADHGVRIAIDDFGTGWSSLVWLKRLPVHAIKVDRSFVGDMVDRPSDAAIVESTINLGHTLGLQVIAEGVETPETLQRLRSFGCDVAQGYLMCRPVPAEELEGWLASRPSWLPRSSPSPATGSAPRSSPLRSAS